MTDKDKRELKDGVISIFKRFNILDHIATIGGLRDDILRYIDSLQEEPVSEDLEEAINQSFIYHENRGDDFRCDEQIETSYRYGFETGAKWQKTKDESCSKDLGEYVNELSKQFPEVSFAKLSRIAVRVAKWQEKQDQSTIELAEDHAMLAGMEKMKEEMMAKAVDVEVKVDAGGYPYIDKTIELYDYYKDVPLAKEGDKYKVILIKEE